MPFISFVDQFKARVVLPAIAAKMNQAGAAWVEEARRLAPVDTGNLRSLIGYTYSQDKMQLNLYSDAPYSIFQEYGTSRTPAHPYMRPALRVVSAIWRGSANLQFPTAVPRYHEKTEKFHYKIHRGNKIKLGHGRFK